MKKKSETEKENEVKPKVMNDTNDDLSEFIRKKNIQNKILKELIEKIKDKK